jgi:hypothetical protein
MFNERCVRSFREAVEKCNIQHVAGWLQEAIDQGWWRERYCYSNIVRCATFREFITGPVPDGCGLDLERIPKILGIDDKYTDLIARYREAVVMPRGGDRKSEKAREIKTDNIRLDFTDGHGTARSYTLDRLRRKVPDLFERVVRGELSAHAAAILAGFRVKTISVPVTVNGCVSAIRKHFNDEQRREIAEAIR